MQRVAHGHVPRQGAVVGGGAEEGAAVAEVMENPGLVAGGEEGAGEVGAGEGSGGGGGGVGKGGEGLNCGS